MKLLPFLCVMFTINDVSGAKAQKCNGGEFPGSPYERLPNDYCIFFFPLNLTYDEAASYCESYAARLVDINTRYKAKQVANIMNAVFNQDRNSWTAHTAWLSSLYVSNGEIIWELAQSPVSGEAKQPGQPEIENDQACAVFDSFDEKWKYSTCKGTHSLLCQEYDPDLDLLP